MENEKIYKTKNTNNKGNKMIKIKVVEKDNSVDGKIKAKEGTIQELAALVLVVEDIMDKTLDTPALRASFEDCLIEAQKNR